MVNKKVLNENDSMDINELASLNDDISPDLIDQLQAKLSNSAKVLNENDSDNAKIEFNENDDATLFEETKVEQENPKKESDKQEEVKDVNETKQKELNLKVDLDNKFDDNFIKKYKAKLKKQAVTKSESNENEVDKSISNAAFSDNVDIGNGKFDADIGEGNIEELTNGNIREYKLSQKQKSYNDSLDFLDNNVKYSKYVIYIDPENVDFIESLTIKERKKLINRILREQDDISITKHRFKVINSVIKHVLVSILIISLSIPLVYNVVNFSLEATINNYRNSKTLFQTLYKENGKITKKVK